MILGGGPAGCATALSLRELCPSLDILLLEASAYDKTRIGEVLPAIARPLLEHLGIREAFEAQGFRSVHSQAAAWGQSQLIENHFIYSARGAGWHLERTHFDRFVFDQAAEQGIEVHLNTRAIAINQTESLWSLQLSNGISLQTRFLVDATGRRATLGRKMGKIVVHDYLTAFVGFFSLGDHPIPGTLIEAFSNGWWYTALTDDRRVVVCLTDSDIARELGLHHPQRWLELFGQTEWIRSSAEDGIFQGKVIVRPANSTCLDQVCDRCWLAVGDAASAYDPLSSQGIVKAMRSGIFAGYAISDLFGKEDPSGLAKYANLVRKQFADYQQMHRQFSDQERRWPCSLFWRRRYSSSYAIVLSYSSLIL